MSPAVEPPVAAATATRLRAGLLALAAATEIGIVVELATARHWSSADQIVPWVATLLASIGIGAVALTNRRHTVRGARIVLATVAASSLFGVWEHLEGNHSAGPLDFRYATTWGSLSTARQWWLAASGGVGPSPPLVPLVMALAAAMALLATVGRTTSEPAGG